MLQVYQARGKTMNMRHLFEQSSFLVGIATFCLNSKHVHFFFNMLTCLEIGYVLQSICVLKPTCRSYSEVFYLIYLFIWSSLDFFTEKLLLNDDHLKVSGVLG